MLYCANTPSRKAATTAYAFDLVYQRVVWIASNEKVGMERMSGALRIDSSCCCDKSLPEDLSTIDSLPSDLGALPSEEIDL